jgi:hypothetical protein
MCLRKIFNIRIEILLFKKKRSFTEDYFDSGLFICGLNVIPFPAIAEVKTNE